MHKSKHNKLNITNTGLLFAKKLSNKFQCILNIKQNSTNWRKTKYLLLIKFYRTRATFKWGTKTQHDTYQPIYVISWTPNNFKVPSAIVHTNSSVICSLTESEKQYLVGIYVTVSMFMKSNTHLVLGIYIYVTVSMWFVPSLKGSIL